MYTVAVIILTALMLLMFIGMGWVILSEKRDGTYDRIKPVNPLYNVKHYKNTEQATYTKFLKVEQGNNIFCQYFKHNGNYGYIIKSTMLDGCGVWVYCGKSKGDFRYKKYMPYTLGLVSVNVLTESKTFFIDNDVQRISKEEYLEGIKNFTKANRNPALFTWKRVWCKVQNIFKNTTLPTP